MKHTKKLSAFYALFFILICTSIHAQKFDIDEFHIPTGLNLSDSEYERLQNTGNQLREKLVADLQVQGYDVISPRASKIRLERVGIDDIKVDYDSKANRVIFGKLLTSSNYITIHTFLYSSENGIRTSHDPLTTTILNRRTHELNDPEEISTAVNEIIAGLSLGKLPDKKAEAQKKMEEEQKRIAEQQKQMEEQKRAKEEQKRIAEQQKQMEEQKRAKEEQKRIAEQQKQMEEQKQIAEQQKRAEEERKRIEEKISEERKQIEKEPKKSTKVCSKTPGAVLIVAGGLMGGTGIYLRSKAKKIYDEEYLSIYEDDPNARDKLEEARKPNRMAHIIGAGGILTAGLGAYLWAKCAKKQKRSTGIGNLQITPHIEYNTMTNTNNVAARISFNF